MLRKTGSLHELAGILRDLVEAARSPAGQRHVAQALTGAAQQLQGIVQWLAG